MFFVDQNLAFDFLNQELDKFEDAGEDISVDIASFGYYLGVTADGSDIDDKYPKKSRAFINRVKCHDLRILIGLNDFNTYPSICRDCPNGKNSYNQKLIRNYKTIDTIGLDGCVRFKEQMHWKIYRLNDIVLVGGMNLSDSSWFDAIYLHENVADIEKTKKLFNWQWENQYLTSQDLDNMILDVDEKYIIKEPPTPQQLGFISILEKQCRLKFEGTTKAEALIFIDEAIKIRDKK